MTFPPIITLTTDFGLQDSYVGVMKGVILSIEPRARMVDLSHGIAPQNIAQAALFLQSAYRYFPADTIHLAVVDPGVGTRRKALAIRTEHGVFVGPDNGLFTYVLEDQGAISGADSGLCGATAVAVTNPAYMRPEVSNTFHGRDIFAPAAAHLARGIPVQQLGLEIERLVVLPHQRPVNGGGEVRGEIVHVDHFGNAITNLRQQELPPSPVFEVAGVSIAGLSSSYETAPNNALVGSSGFVEVAIRNGTAAMELGLRVGDTVLVRGSA